MKLGTMEWTKVTKPNFFEKHFLGEIWAGFILNVLKIEVLAISLSRNDGILLLSHQVAKGYDI